ncbi:lipopolysaccharide kinase InaA family protein [Paludisphaera borealis]|uniref:Lipopolysaccharide core heptose(I) kinase RfaP n=1 Tax=Paludisphaera borealis TaxID=1387353 RepID=A0A1U7CWV2_9BACT|nr:lipopolysaccharide kinase InaA family protein [Paludisphaera borealis]APW63369.1 Lipopolysaccharide core heptose(I) kinase RfaP [Paludisphaera borealis]
MNSTLPTRRSQTASKRMFKPPDWRFVQAGDVGWWVHEPWRDLLLDSIGLRLDQWRAEGRVTTVKSGPHRVVYRVQLPDFAVYIKHYLVPDRRAKYRQWFRRGKGRNEGKRSESLASIGVPTISPIALGERRKHGFLFDNYLITREIPDSTPLDAFVERNLEQLSEPRRSRVRRRLATAVGVFTARLHNAGLLHIDFHPGNVLVRLDSDDTPVLMMIDLDALRTVKKLSWVKAQQNLALLDHYFWLRSSRADRHRFLKAYLAFRNDAHPPVRSFAKGVEESTRRWAERLWRRWGKRCRSTNKYFQVYQSPNAWCVASRDLDPADIEPLLTDPDAPFDSPNARLIKDSRTTRLAETTMRVNGVPTPVIYKRFNRKKWIDPVLAVFRPSRAWRSWQAGQHLASRGIPTPQNLAFVSRRRKPWFSPFEGMLPHETYQITIKQEHATTLLDHVLEVLPQLDPATLHSEVRRTTLALASLVRSLHERSLSHRDLKASNILICHDRSVRDGFLSLIDLVGVRLQNPVPMNRRVQNLARLSVSLSDAPGRTRTESLRFLRAYLPRGLAPSSGWKDLWRAIDKATRTKQARNHRRGRPLS